MFSVCKEFREYFEEEAEEEQLNNTAKPNCMLMNVLKVCIPVQTKDLGGRRRTWSGQALGKFFPSEELKKSIHEGQGN